MDAVAYVLLAALIIVVITLVARARTRGPDAPKPATNVPEPVMEVAEIDPRVTAVGERAASLGDAVLEEALMRLRGDRIGASVPVEEWGEAIRQESLSLHTGSGAALRGAAADLLARWEDPEEDARTFLFSAVTTRHPLLGLFVDTKERAGLERLAEGTKVEGARAIMAVVKPVIEEMTSAQATLRDRKAMVWSVETLLVPAVAELGRGSESERLVLDHVRKFGRDGDAVAARIDAAMRAALGILATTPFEERKHHEGTLAVPLRDLSFGVAVAKWIGRRDGQAGLAGRARLVARGVWGMHWLAFEVARRLELERASEVFLALVPEARKASKSAPEARAAALDAFETSARAQLDEGAAKELRAVLARIADGASQAEVVGGAPGHERRRVAEWKAAAEEDLGQEVAAPSM